MCKQQKWYAGIFCELRRKVCADRVRLGLVANYADFSKNLKLKDVQREDNVVKDYYMINTKQNKFHYVSNKMDLIFENKDGHCMTVAFCVANNSVAFRYELQKPNNEKGIPLSAVILKETTSFRLAEAATKFPLPAEPTNGWFC